MAKISVFTEKMTKDVIEIAKKAKAVKEGYAYLNDELPLEGWIWEFISRNRDYVILYNEIMHDFITIDILQGCTDLDDIHDNIVDSPIGRKLNRLSKEFGIEGSLLRPKPHDADNFMNIDKYDFLIVIPNPIKGYDKFCRETPQIEGTKCVKCITLTVDNKNSFIIDNRYVNHSSFFADNCREVIMKKLPPVDPSDTIYFGVSMNAKKSDIMQQIGKFIDDKLKTDKKRARDDKWKYYLITFDLYNKGNKYDDISKIMTKAFENEIPEDIQEEEAKRDKKKRKRAKAFERLFDVKNIENYYKNALALINGEYRTHLFLEK